MKSKIQIKVQIPRRKNQMGITKTIKYENEESRRWKQMIKNFETDHPSGRNKTEEMNSSFENCKNNRQICYANFDVDNFCKGLDLISLEQCSYRTINGTKYCGLHADVKLILHYMKFFVSHFTDIKPLYSFDETVGEDKIYVSKRMQEYLKNELYILREKHVERTVLDAADIFFGFLEGLLNYILNAEDDWNRNEYKYRLPFNVKEFLRGVQQKSEKKDAPEVRFCIGTDLTNGQRCGRVRQSGTLCGIHDCLHAFHKLFVHSDREGDGLHPNTVHAIYLNVPDGFPPNSYNRLMNLNSCVRNYMEVVLRLQNHAISQHETTAEIFESSNIRTNKAFINCRCQCVGDDVMQRLQELQYTIDENYPNLEN